MTAKTWSACMPSSVFGYSERYSAWLSLSGGQVSSTGRSVPAVDVIS